MRFNLTPLAVLAATTIPAFAQVHGSHANHGPTTAITAPGQAAFGALQEIVAQLHADPETDWNEVDIDGLRAHLIDMDNVTMRARVRIEDFPHGAAFHVSSEEPEVRTSIQAMVLAHAATMDGVGGLQQVAEKSPDGAVLRVTGTSEDKARILALGFFGVLSLGEHHQAHHLAMARGDSPHAHGAK